MNELLSIGIMILCGIALGTLVKLVKLPHVTGYLIAGLIIGPSVLGLIHHETLETLKVMPEVALGFIAFSIGQEFKFSYFKRVGTLPIVIAVFEALFAVIIVFAAMMAFGQPLLFSLVMSSIAAATAPAATVMVINQYRARGEVTETLLSVVAIDDAVALILFGIAAAVATSMQGESVSLLTTITKPFIEIFLSVGIGIGLGIMMVIPLNYVHGKGIKLSIIASFILIGIGVATQFHLSGLLLCMGMGAAVANLFNDHEEVASMVEAFTPPIFVLFFVMSGAELQLSVLPTIGLVGSVYIIFRVIGKVFGAYVGAAVKNGSPKIKKYLGMCLIPQAGVAIGLSLAAAQVVPQYAETIRAVTLSATLIYELVGPAISKYALTKAGEIKADH